MPRGSNDPPGMEADVAAGSETRHDPLSVLLVPLLTNNHFYTWGVVRVPQLALLLAPLLVTIIISISVTTIMTIINYYCCPSCSIALALVRVLAFVLGLAPAFALVLILVL